MSTENNAYEYTAVDGVGKSASASKLTIFLALLLTLINCPLAFFLASQQNIQLGAVMSGGGMIGAFVAPVILGVIVVGLFQVMARFRNPASRWKIYCWVMVLAIVSSIGRVVDILKGYLP